MIDPNMSDREKQCLRILAKLFEDGDTWPSDPRSVMKEKGLDLDYQAYEPLMSMMEQYGAIANVTHVMGNEGRFVLFGITPVAVQLARELDALEKQSQEPRDIVDELKGTARKHWFWAYMIIGSVVLAAALTIINQGFQLLQNFGIIGK